MSSNTNWMPARMADDKSFQEMLEEVGFWAFSRELKSVALVFSPKEVFRLQIHESETDPGSVKFGVSELDLGNPFDQQILGRLLGFEDV